MECLLNRRKLTPPKPSDPSPQLAEAEVKNAPTNESNDVEMSDGDQASLSTQPENANAEGVVDMDVDRTMNRARKRLPWISKTCR